MRNHDSSFNESDACKERTLIAIGILISKQLIIQETINKIIILSSIKYGSSHKTVS